MSLETDFERIELPLEDAFVIARRSQEAAENVVVTVSDGEHTGVGGAAPAVHYGETPATVEAVLPDLLGVVESVGDPHALGEIERRMRETVRRNPAARCAVEVACHDLLGKRLSLPLYRYWGLAADAPPSSYTIGLDSTERMGEKTREAIEAGYEVLKVKLGTDRDLEIIEAVREAAPDTTIRVDANEAWRPNEAVRVIRDLAALDIEFVEQPVPAENPSEMEFVHERSVLPIAADESCVTLPDVPRVAGRATIANIKLMKCGGLREARRMIHAARAHGLEVMLGCMIESNASIAAACQLAPLVDYVDLDGSLLLAEDPFEGIPMAAGRIDLGGHDQAGTGAGTRS
jgi:L-alanine-DL-glutamate epimerase-like enolase superfamily enzyme